MLVWESYDWWGKSGLGCSAASGEFGNGSLGRVVDRHEKVKPDDPEDTGHSRVQSGELHVASSGGKDEAVLERFRLAASTIAAARRGPRRA